MKYFVALLMMKDGSKNEDFRPRHIEFLGQMDKDGKIFARGGFADGAGGMVIYRTQSEEEAREIAEKDPYVLSGARSLELHEWNMKVSE